MSIRTEMIVCTCGREAEEPYLIELRPCPECAEPSCDQCRHRCAHCKHEGCESCMMKFKDPGAFEPLYFCSEDCRDAHIDPYGLLGKANEDKRNMAAAIRQYVPLLLEVTTFNSAGERERNYVAAGLHVAAELYLKTVGL